MKKFLKNYTFILCMLAGIVSGCAVGLLWPEFAGKLKPLGTLFTNMMFCLVVPMVFCSIASAIANMPSAKKAGKVMGVTVATFLPLQPSRPCCFTSLSVCSPLLPAPMKYPPQTPVRLWVRVI